MVEKIIKIWESNLRRQNADPTYRDASEVSIRIAVIEGSLQASNASIDSSDTGNNDNSRSIRVLSGSSGTTSQRNS